MKHEQCHCKGSFVLSHLGRQSLQLLPSWNFFTSSITSHTSSQKGVLLAKAIELPKLGQFFVVPVVRLEIWRKRGWVASIPVKCMQWSSITVGHYWNLCCPFEADLYSSLQFTVYSQEGRWLCGLAWLLHSRPSLLEARLNLFHLKHIAKEEGRDLYGPEDLLHEEQLTGGVQAVEVQQREEDLLFSLTSHPAGWCFLPRSQLLSAGLCLGENQMVKIAKPLWCA